MEILADESVDYGIVKEFFRRKINIMAITDTHSGISDKEVLKVAVNKNRLLITEDKDFGELTYRLRLKHKGILLIRLTGIKRQERITSVVQTVFEHYNELINNFSVLDENGLRIKKSDHPFL